MISVIDSEGSGSHYIIVCFFICFTFPSQFGRFIPFGICNEESEHGVRGGENWSYIPGVRGTQSQMGNITED